MDIEDKVRVDCYNHGYEQGKKDTAKEILRQLLNIKSCTLIRSQIREGWDLAFDKARKEIAKRYGVEVE